MLKLDITDDRAILSLSPDDVAAGAFSVDLVLARLSESGVCCGILQKTIDDAVRQVTQQNKPVTDVVVAQWIEPQPGEPARFMPLLGDQQVVAAGDTIATVASAVEPVDGKSILGEIIAAPEVPVTDATAAIHTHIENNKLKATVYGRVTVTDKDISVALPVEVRDDDMAACIDIHPRSFTGTPITLEMLQASLAAAGVVYGVDEEELAALLGQVLESDSALLKAPVAEGTPGIKGEDAYIEYMIELEQGRGEEREDGSIDYRARHIIHNVQNDVLICRRIPPQAGTARVDVFGKTVPAEGGIDINLQAGQNTEQRDNEIWSAMDGAVMIINGAVSVVDMFSVPGDIDLETGNLESKKGAVDIGGTVHSGFEVIAAGHIIVKGLVDNATLQAGGDVQIGGGVFHADSGVICADGNVTAKFAQNAKIRAGGDIFIAGPALNCDLLSASQVILAGKRARLIGGVVSATGGVEVPQLGSTAEVTTRVEVGVNRQAINIVKCEIRQCEAAIEAGQATDADKEALLRRLHELLNPAEKNAVIKVSGTVYPGVTVSLFHNDYTFSTEARHCKIWLDQEQKIQVSPL